MKKATAAICSLFTVANALFLSLGTECLLYLLSATMISAIGSLSEFSNIISLSVVLGIVALSGLIGVLILSVKLSQKYHFSKAVWYIQYLGAAVLSIPMLKLWELLFDHLTKTL